LRYELACAFTELGRLGANIVGNCDEQNRFLALIPAGVDELAGFFDDRPIRLAAHEPPRYRRTAFYPPPAIPATRKKRKKRPISLTWANPKLFVASEALMHCRCARVSLAPAGISNGSRGVSVRTPAQ